MRFFSRRATSSRGRRRLLAPCDKSSKEGLGEPCRIHVRLAGCGLPLLRLYHALAGIMGVDREGGYAISFLTRVGGGITRVGGGITRVGGGITRVKGDRVCFLDSDLAIIPCSVRAESMTSLFTSELRSATLPPAGREHQPRSAFRRMTATLPPRAVSIRMAIVEAAAGRIRAGSVPNCTPGTD